MPLRPPCAICVSDLDGNGALTSCSHFLCQRCMAKYPPGVCPRCKKPCRVILLSSPDFPRDVAERLAADPNRLFANGLRALEMQHRIEVGATARLKELVTGLNNANRTMATELRDSKARVASLEEELAHTKREFSQYRSQHNHSAPTRRSGAGYGPPSPQQHDGQAWVNRNSRSLDLVPAASATPGWQTPNNGSVSRPLPTASEAPSWGRHKPPASVGRKRLRQTGDGHHRADDGDGAPTPTAERLLDMASTVAEPPGGDDKFRLATPAITLANFPRKSPAAPELSMMPRSTTMPPPLMGHHGKS